MITMKRTCCCGATLELQDDLEVCNFSGPPDSLKSFDAIMLRWETEHEKCKPPDKPREGPGL
jgi:hypothetical protein